MGADFCFASLPAFRLTDKRLEELLALVEKIDVGEDPLGEDPEADNDMVCIRDAAYEGVKMLRDFITGREVETITMDGAEYFMWVTGGMSWGEPPTDAYEPFINMSEFDAVEQKMLEWSKADFKELGKEKMLKIVCNGGE